MNKDIDHGQTHSGIATITYSSDRVNSYDAQFVKVMRQRIEGLAGDDAVRGVVLTANGPFFSFGFNVPLFLDWPREDFEIFLNDFTSLYLDIFRFPKPIVAALNGHTVAGGCMIALACDQRVMVDTKAKISLNEVTFGAGLFTGAVEILRHWVGPRVAEDIAMSGRMLQPEEAKELGLIDLTCEPQALLETARERVERLARNDLRAYANIKRLSRCHSWERIQKHEGESIRHFLDLWYSPETRDRLEQILIR